MSKPAGLHRFIKRTPTDIVRAASLNCDTNNQNAIKNNVNIMQYCQNIPYESQINGKLLPNNNDLIYINPDVYQTVKYGEIYTSIRGIFFFILFCIIFLIIIFFTRWLLFANS